MKRNNNNIMRQYSLFVFFFVYPLKVSTSSDSRVTFGGHKLYEVEMNGSRTLAENLIRLREEMDIDFWDEPGIELTRINFRVPPEYQSKIEATLEALSVPHRVLTNDLQKWVDDEIRRNNCSHSLPSSLGPRNGVLEFPLHHYHTFDEINDFMERTSRAYPHIAELKCFGHTFENRTISGLKLGSSREGADVRQGTNAGGGGGGSVGEGGGKGGGKKAIWIDAGIHAREWIAPATALFIIHKLTTGYGKETTDLMDTYDWYIVPCVNPDGYVHSWLKNRFWRKNRSTPKTRPLRFPWNLLTDCVGTDLNRNFDVSFGGRLGSSNPCSETFRGDQPFSENESRAIGEAIAGLGESLQVYVTLHSYSQMWMIPFAYTIHRSPDYHQLLPLLSQVVAAVEAKNGESYKYGAMSSLLYSASGSSPDWVYQKAGVKHSFIVELRDRGQRGFLLPNHLILPTAEETWAGIQKLAHLVQMVNSSLH